MEIPAGMLAAQAALVPIAMVIPGVRGVDVGLREVNGFPTEDLAIRVLVADINAVPPGIPTEMSGFPVVVVQRDPQPGIDRVRYSPVVGGISIGTVTGVLSSSGTMGGIARENNTGELRGVTNARVIGTNFGTQVYQPEPTTSPQPPADLIGTLVRASFPTTPTLLPPFTPTGFTDAACFTVERAAQASIAELGFYIRMGTAQIGDQVSKRGRTTGLTHGMITARGAYNNGTAWLLDQYEVTVDQNLSATWSAQGDSGSLVVRPGTGEIVGLHWGHSASGPQGYFSDISTTCAELGISFDWPVPQVHSVSPSNVSPFGGTQVTIDGVGFQLATGVFFNGMPAQSFFSQNDQRVIATVPAGIGIAIIAVSAPGGMSDVQFGATVSYF